MNFSTDRDLLAHEPNVFTDVPLVSQQRLRVSDGVVAGQTLSSAAGDFVLARVEPGAVVLIAGVPCEVITRVDAHQLTVSLLRTGLADPAVPPAAGNDLEVVARTFEPQAALVHDALLKMIGLDPDDADQPDGDDAVVSLSVLARLEALGTLERVYSSAFALTGDNRALQDKAQLYRNRFNAACRQATVLLDLDGDGHADTRRSLGVIGLVRA